MIYVVAASFNLMSVNEWVCALKIATAIAELLHADDDVDDDNNKFTSGLRCRRCRRQCVLAV